MMLPGLRSWWHMKAPRERRMIVLLAAVAAGVLAWMLLLDPIARDVARLERDRMSVRQALDLARHDAEETARLARAPLPPAADAHGALDTALEQIGLRASLSKIEWHDRSARLTFASVAFDDLVIGLERLHRDAGLAVQDATLSGLVAPGMVRAELTVAR